MRVRANAQASATISRPAGLPGSNPCRSGYRRWLNELAEVYLTNTVGGGPFGQSQGTHTVQLRLVRSAPSSTMSVETKTHPIPAPRADAAGSTGGTGRGRAEWAKLRLRHLHKYRWVDLLAGLIWSHQTRCQWLLRLTRPVNLFQPSPATQLNRYPEIFRFVRAHVGDGADVRLLSFGCSTGEEVFSLRQYFPSAGIKGLEHQPTQRRHLFLAAS